MKCNSIKNLWIVTLLAWCGFFSDLAHSAPPTELSPEQIRSFFELPPHELSIAEYERKFIITQKRILAVLPENTSFTGEHSNRLLDLWEKVVPERAHAQRFISFSESINLRELFRDDFTENLNRQNAENDPQLTSSLRAFFSAIGAAESRLEYTQSVFYGNSNAAYGSAPSTLFGGGTPEQKAQHQKWLSGPLHNELLQESRAQFFHRLRYFLSLEKTSHSRFINLTLSTNDYIQGQFLTLSAIQEGLRSIAFNVQNESTPSSSAVEKAAIRHQMKERVELYLFIARLHQLLMKDVFPLFDAFPWLNSIIQTNTGKLDFIQTIGESLETPTEFIYNRSSSSAPHFLADLQLELLNRMKKAPLSDEVRHFLSNYTELRNQYLKKTERENPEFLKFLGDCYEQVAEKGFLDQTLSKLKFYNYYWIVLLKRDQEIQSRLSNLARGRGDLFGSDSEAETVKNIKDLKVPPPPVAEEKVAWEIMAFNALEMEWIVNHPFLKGSKEKCGTDLRPSYKNFPWPEIFEN
jgi:hypothetical protein